MEGARQDHTYSRSMIHLLTNAADRYIVGDRFHDGPKTSGHKKSTCRYHNIDLCPELISFQSITSEVLNSKIKSTRFQSSNQQNLHHYFFYNRLMDHCRLFISNGSRCIRELNQEKPWLEMCFTTSAMCAPSATNVDMYISQLSPVILHVML